MQTKEKTDPARWVSEIRHLPRSPPEMLFCVVAVIHSSQERERWEREEEEEEDAQNGSDKPGITKIRDFVESRVKLLDPNPRIKSGNELGRQVKTCMSFARRRAAKKLTLFSYLRYKYIFLLKNEFSFLKKINIFCWPNQEKQSIQCFWTTKRNRYKIWTNSQIL